MIYVSHTIFITKKAVAAHLIRPWVFRRDNDSDGDTGLSYITLHINSILHDTDKVETYPILNSPQSPHIWLVRLYILIVFWKLNNSVVTGLHVVRLELAHPHLCGTVTPFGDVEPSNGLSTDGKKALPEPTSIYHMMTS